MLKFRNARYLGPLRQNFELGECAHEKWHPPAQVADSGRIATASGAASRPSCQYFMEEETGNMKRILCIALTARRFLLSESALRNLVSGGAAAFAV